MFSQELVKAIQIAINARVPMWLWGQTGVGKSSIAAVAMLIWMPNYIFPPFPESSSEVKHSMSRVA